MRKLTTVDDCRRFQQESRTYTKVLEHRRNCPLWGKSFCLDCFGGGLTQFTKDLEQERLARKGRTR